MDSPSFTYNMRYQIRWRRICTQQVPDAPPPYSVLLLSIWRWPRERPTQTWSVDKSHCEDGDRSLQISCIGASCPLFVCFSPRFDRILFISVFFFVFHFLRVCCVLEYTDQWKSWLLRKRLGSIIGKRTRPRVRGYDVSSSILPGFPGSWNDEESSKPPHDWYHAALTGIWGQLG